MITTLNPKVSGFLSVFSVAVMIYSYIHNAFSLVSFFIGIIIGLPLAIGVWQVIEGNWDNIYKKFFSKEFYTRDKNVIYGSWKLTWWIVPWTLVVYTMISFAMMEAMNDMNVVFSFVFGSVFVLSAVTHQKSPRFYKEINK